MLLLPLPGEILERTGARRHGRVSEGSGVTLLETAWAVVFIPGMERDVILKHSSSGLVMCTKPSQVMNSEWASSHHKFFFFTISGNFIMVALKHAELACLKFAGYQDILLYTETKFKWYLLRKMIFDRRRRDQSEYLFLFCPIISNSKWWLNILELTSIPYNGHGITRLIRG